MKKLFILLALVVSAGFIQAQDRQAFSLEDAIDYALQNSLEIKNAQLNVADAKEQVVERRAIGLPQISAGANYQYFIDIPTQILPDFITPSVYGVLFQEGLVEPFNLSTGEGVAAQFGTKHNLTAGVDLSTLIFDGSYFIGLKAAKAYKKYSMEELESTRTNLRYQVVNAYLPTLLITENLRLLDQNISNVEKLLNETRALYKEGFVEQLDVDRLYLSFANLQTERDNLVRQQAVAINALKFTLGYPMDEPLEVTDKIEDLLEEAPAEDLEGPVNVAARPEYDVLNSSITLNELNVKLNRAGYLPSLAAFGSYQQSLLTNDLSNAEWFPTTVVGLRLNVPIFDGLNKKAKVQRAQIDLEQMQNQRRLFERSVSLEFENAKTNYLNAQQRLNSQEKNMELAQRIYDTTQIKYREGVGSSLELTQAEQSLYQSQQNYIQALYQLLEAKTALDKALGK
jgi:outer membrane protein